MAALVHTSRPLKATMRFCRTQPSPNVALFDAEHGPFLETVVATELQRLFGWSDSRPLRLLHWRMNERREVDLVVERGDGKVLALEVKAARQLTKDAGQGIQAFRHEHPDTFHRGFVIHAGDRIERLDENIWALPVSALWRVGNEVRPQPTLEERLARAVELIHQQESPDRQTAQRARERQAWELFVPAARSLLAFAKPLNSLGIDTNARQPSPQRVGDASDSTDEVAWRAHWELELTATQRCTLSLTAELRESGLRWSLQSTGAYKDDFGGPFTTGFAATDLVLLEERLGAAAERLPEIVQTIRRSTSGTS